MKNKWKDLFIGMGLITIGTMTEAAWTGLLVLGTSKIPYIGIPIATLLGITGTLCTLYIANEGRFYYKDWQNQYFVITT